ncbi:MAG: pyruvate dehydrogenase (acetyl-transferring) E1 component subunit alpha [Desulfobacteraceae bacterium]|nr:MAG: pyruvate dehydrogenase (acetyl-transferring) E1 component subunit alpha [Desulfobacteraceae bacterium]
MPFQEIDVEHRVRHLSILDPEGRVDKELEPDIPDEMLLKLHRMMLFSRRFDERLLSLQRQGRIGTFAPIKGQEASQLGAAAVLEDGDWLIPAFREMAAELWRGKTPENVLLVYGGFNEGGVTPEDVNIMPVAIPVGTHMLHAVGIGYGMRYDGKDRVAMTFFGDGATSEGDFHEAMNFAGVMNTPVVFVCQNNHWAISVPLRRQTRSKTLAQKAFAYGIPGIQVDGNDILAVYAAAKEAVDRARSGGGPTLIECITYRMAVHTTADDPTRYRKEEEVKEWEKKDPLIRFQRYLKAKKIWSEKEAEKLEKEIAEEIKQAVNRFEEKAKSYGDSLVMFDYVFEDLPPYIREQKEELRQELEEKKEA